MEEFIRKLISQHMKTMRDCSPQIRSELVIEIHKLEILLGRISK